MKLKTASEFDSFWMSTLNKAQWVGREGGYGHDNTLRGGEGGSALNLKAANEFDSFWMSTLNKAQVGRERGREGMYMRTHLEEGRGGEGLP